MSTIFGIYGRTDRIIEKKTIQSMENGLSYWEPDDRGIWKEGNIVFGHQMLWNTPESKLEHLPRVTNLLVITIDSRLDNREELSNKLGMLNRPIENTTDSELVLAAYQKWGELCPKYLLGDFAFSIWDESKQHLFCVRDHIGIKPFYYHMNKNSFIFSSDIRGLTSCQVINKQYNERSIAMCLDGAFGFYDEEDTFFEEIQKLPAATSMTITKEYISKNVYWNVDNVKEVYYDNYEDYEEKLKELLFSAVNTRLRTIYPVASHLSGGIDSTSVAVLAARELRRKSKILYAFNWVETPDKEFDPEYSEWGFSTKIAYLEKIEQKQIRLSAEFMAEMYNDVDFTKNGISFFWEEFQVRNEAERHGVRTILSGWGGDELISNNGHAYFSGLLWQGDFIKAIKKLYELYSYKERKYKYLRIIKRLLRDMIYPLFYKQMSGLYQEGKYKKNSYEFTHGKFSGFSEKQFFDKLIFHPSVHNEQKALFTNGHLLQRIESWASSAIEKKLEYSYPLLDKRLVEFALAIPEDMYAWKNGYQRHFYRSTITDFLPEYIAWAPKNAEPERVKVWERLWHDALMIWMKKNDKALDNRNYYVDRSKIIKRIKTYVWNKENGIEDYVDENTIITSILLSNLDVKS